MTRRFPLLDGSEIDLDNELLPHLDIGEGGDRSIALRDDFEGDALKSWESYTTNGGPSSPTFNGLSAGGKTTISLSSPASADTSTLISGPTINWSEWSDIRVVAWGINAPSTQSISYLSLGDDPELTSYSEGFDARLTAAGDGTRPEYTAESGDADLFSSQDLEVGVFDTEYSLGFRLYESDNSAGHTLEYFLNGEYRTGWAEGRGFPAATDLTFGLGVFTLDGIVKTLSIDGWAIELIP